MVGAGWWVSSWPALVAQDTGTRMLTVVAVNTASKRVRMTGMILLRATDFRVHDIAFVRLNERVPLQAANKQV
ncbi:hypothetical protein MSZK_53820 [Mycobacterium sp. shizuoka-1]|nr:hypothetical protein MSZK_53820 [Mycobacterium sp. shizuoka-1]